MKLGHRPKLQNVAHILSFHPRGQNWSYSHSTAAVSEMRADFQRCYLATGQSSRNCTHTGRFSKLPYLDRKLGHWPKFQKLQIYSHSTQWVKIELIFAQGQRFPRYGSFFKIAIFGHSSWPLAKVPQVARILFFYPKGSNWAYFCSTGSFFRGKGRFSKLPYLVMKL